MRWFKRLKSKWELSTFRAAIVLVVFACTGFTVLYLKEQLLSLIVPEEDRNWMFTVAYYVLILPIYNVILLIYGFIFGQFNFFWEFEKRMFGRMLRNKKSSG